MSEHAKLVESQFEEAAKQLMFERKKESRFKFANSVVHHSVDPARMVPEEDDDQIQVPKKIQDLIERGIRTLSHSLSVKSKTNADVKSTALQEAYEEEVTGITTQNLNRMLEMEARPQDLSEIKELRERWLTKRELHLMSQAEQSAGETGLLHSPCPLVSKGKFVPKADESEEVLADTKSAGYNVTRVKLKGD